MAEMNAELKSVIEKIQKLMNLGNSPNPNEAASALARAAELMAKYQIQQADLSIAGDEAELKLKEYALYDHEGKRRAPWKEILGYALGKLFNCKVFSRGNNLRLYGSENDSNTVKYIFMLIVTEVEFYTDEVWKAYGKRVSSTPITWKNSFRQGCIDGVCERLLTMKKDIMKDAGKTALVVYDRKSKMIEEWASKIKWKYWSAGNSNINNHAYSVGKLAGLNNINVGDQASDGIRGPKGYIKPPLQQLENKTK